MAAQESSTLQPTKIQPIVHLLKSEERVGDVTVDKDLILTYPFASEFDYYGDYYDIVNGQLANVLIRILNCR